MKEMLSGVSLCLYNFGESEFENKIRIDFIKTLA
jgi:hypothetical protein